MGSNSDRTHFVYNESCLSRPPVFLLGCEFVGLPVLVLVNHGISETRFFQTRMRLDYLGRASSIPNTICESDKQYTAAREIVRCPHSLSEAPGDLIPVDC